MIWAVDRDEQAEGAPAETDGRCEPALGASGDGPVEQAAGEARQVGDRRRGLRAGESSRGHRAGLRLHETISLVWQGARGGGPATAAAPPSLPAQAIRTFRPAGRTCASLWL